MSNDPGMIAASAMAGLERQLDFCAKNLANARVPGFHARLTSTKSFESELGDLEHKLVKTDESISFGRGVIVPDQGNPLSVAIEGPGFFEIDTPSGSAFTRSGDFALDSEGALVSRAGYRILGAAGAAIRAEPGLGAVSIDAMGAVLQGDSEVGRLRLTDFADKALLEAVSDTLFRPLPGAAPVPVDSPALKTQSLEYADETSATALVDLIKIHRQFDAAQHVLQSISDSYQQRIRSIS
jgi:flagellar basal-body rod protein FlgF